MLKHLGSLYYRQFSGGGPGAILILCGFVDFTTMRFVLSPAVFCSLVFFSVLFSIVITSLGAERAGLCVFRAFVCLFCMR